MRLATGLISASVLMAGLPLLAACDWMSPRDAASRTREENAEKAEKKSWQRACASEATYDRLKQVAFDEAIRIRNADPENLDLLATHSVVRMEQPIVKRRDDRLDVTVCSGEFILELPPGAERAFEGQRRLRAEVEYSAQAAADGSGLVYQIKGAEPIIYKLAAFDLKGQAYGSRATETRASAPVGGPSRADGTAPVHSAAVPASVPVDRPVRAEPAPPPRSPSGPRTAPPSPPQTPPADRSSSEPVRGARASPSFNCRYARSTSERMVCGDERLASLDRAMSSRYYSALGGADRQTRAELRRTRDRFLAYRDRCPDQACVADAYRGRMAEIADIVGR